MRSLYRGYNILRTTDVPPELGSATYVWEWWHDNYDGAPDARDHRMGYGRSLQDAKRLIDEQITELEPAQ